MPLVCVAFYGEKADDVSLHLILYLLILLNISARSTIINQQNVPIVNPVQQSSQDNNTPPPPYNTQCPSNFEDSLPSYERAVNRPS